MSDEQGPKKKLPAGIIVLLIVGACGIPGIGVLMASAVFGVKKYLQNAKSAEGRVMVVALANGVARCAGGLPPSSRAVPSAPPAAARYQSVPGDWRDEAFHCSG